MFLYLQVLHIETALTLGISSACEKNTLQGVSFLVIFIRREENSLVLCMF